MDKKLFLEILDKNINQEQLAADLMGMMLIPMLEKFVADTENPYDNMLIEAVKKFMGKK